MDEEEAPDLLLDAVRRLGAQYDLGATLVSDDARDADES
jgi:hypothetical protein